MRFSREKITIFLAIAFFVLYMFAKYYIGKSQEENISSLRNQTGSGLSIALKFLDKKAHVYTDPILQSFNLPNGGLFVIDSPIFPISEKEKTVLKHYVYQGGHLYMTFLREENFKALLNLTQSFSLPTSIKKNPWFKNYQATPIPDNESRSMYMYSNFIFNDPKCINSKTKDCYVREATYGQGKVFLQAGLPVFSNALMTYKENQQYLLELAKNHRVVGIDGYHQFFAQKSWSDLFANGRIIFPLFSFILLIIGYLVFRPHYVFENEILPGPHKKSYHELYKQVMVSEINHRRNWPVIVNELGDLIFKKSVDAKMGRSGNDNQKDVFFRRVQSLINRHKIDLNKGSVK